MAGWLGEAAGCVQSWQGEQEAVSVAASAQ
jgi:hypothetical protein